jgi:drug/metabolite transporter superfamily protein YnfA
VELTILFPILLFWALVTFGITRLPLGVIILILALPPLFRYQSFVVEAYAGSKVPGAFDAEFFSWIGTAWTLFPLVLAALFGIGGAYATDAWGSTGTWFVIALAAAIYPASLAVLAITHSSLQAMNPIAIFRIYHQVGAVFLAAPMYFLVLFWLVLQAGSLPLSLSVLAGLFSLFSLAALVGSLIAPRRLIHDVYIPDPLEKTVDEISVDTENVRMAALSHAYAFASRDNREGGFKHIFAEIENDPNPVAAWAWYFERMLGWEQQQHALFFAQHYIHDMLEYGEHIPALKVIMRCRLIDPQFKPLYEDIPVAIEVAENSGNIELATVLKQG